ncbi:MAG: inositol monophosphatase family protein [Bacteroidota bacterium]|nr:inositol monophosphatase family protein [Bacteroidota bacterium]
MKVKTDVLGTACEAARTGGDVLRSFFGNLYDIESKEGLTNNLVTEADRASEEAIVSVIHRAFPDHDILGEEGGRRARYGAYRWIIDPLDGTTNFAHGLPIYSVSIGVENQGEIIAGVVFDPSTGEMFMAEKGAGSYCNGKRLRVSTVDSLERAMLVTGFPYRVRENPDLCQERFLAFLIRAQAVRRLGSAALDCAYVAAGRFDGFWETVLNPWDKAAGVLLIEEAGGIVSDFAGGPHDIYAPSILASNGLIHSMMIEVLGKAREIRIIHP